MRSLVTGGAGFIGSNLVDCLLAEGHEVAVVDDLSTGKLQNLEGASGSDRLTFHELSITDPDLATALGAFKPEVVFHLAAQIDVRVSVAKPVFDAEVNICGTLNLLEASVAAGVERFVFASSGGTIYGEPERIPVDESHPQKPLSPYGVAKKVVGDYLYYYKQLKGLESFTLALANVFGPRQDPHGEAGVVAILGGLMLDGETPTLFGDGTQTRDFVFVGDVVDAFVLAAAAPGGDLVNIGTGKQTSVVELYDEVAAICDFTEKPGFAPPRLGELMHIALDASKAERVLGWTPKTSLTEGLRQTIAWLAESRGAPS